VALILLVMIKGCYFN